MQSPITIGKENFDGLLHAVRVLFFLRAAVDAKETPRKYLNLAISFGLMLVSKYLNRAQHAYHHKYHMRTRRGGNQTFHTAQFLYPD